MGQQTCSMGCRDATELGEMQGAMNVLLLAASFKAPSNPFQAASPRPCPSFHLHRPRQAARPQRPAKGLRGRRWQPSRRWCQLPCTLHEQTVSCNPNHVVHGGRVCRAHCNTARGHCWGFGNARAPQKVPPAVGLSATPSSSSVGARGGPVSGVVSDRPAAVFRGPTAGRGFHLVGHAVSADLHLISFVRIEDAAERRDCCRECLAGAARLAGRRGR